MMDFKTFMLTVVVVLVVVELNRLCDNDLEKRVDHLEERIEELEDKK